jgi:hypothetical protein
MRQGLCFYPGSYIFRLQGKGFGAGKKIDSLRSFSLFIFSPHPSFLTLRHDNSCEACQGTDPAYLE